MTPHEICEAATVVIFGASGDLTRRKLIPALYNLHLKERLSSDLRIVGVSRSELSHEAFREQVRQGVETFSAETFDAGRWNVFAERIFYVPGNATEAEDYTRLEDFVTQATASTANRLYYLSTAPSLYEPILANLKQAGMAEQTDGWRRIVVEKPFGYDGESAVALNDVVHATFDEDQVYRIDHYLGKETAQNILFLRFANTIFEPIWNRNYVSNIQITVAEAVDVGKRGAYYDASGVLRDMFQNHLMQLLALTTMEPPISLAADHIRDEKAKALNAIRMPNHADVVHAQYSSYRELPDVAQASQTPTYAALRLYIDNWRWQGVPFYLRSGKALKRKASEIAVQFKEPPLPLFGPQRKERTRPNTLSLCIQPDEGIHLGFEAKLPDQRVGDLVEMEFHYADAFGKQAIPDAYQRLLLDALLGDATLFAREDEIAASWRLIDHIRAARESDGALPLVHYDPGTWGPVEADDLLDEDGFSWYLGCEHCD